MMSIRGLGQTVTGIEAIMQCVDIILTTQKGSDPLRPDFGVDSLAFMGKPIPQARAALLLQVTEQIARYEPRIELVKTSATASADGNLVLSLEWDSAQGVGSNQATFEV